MKLTAIVAISAAVWASQPARQADAVAEIPFAWTPGQIEVPVSVDGTAPATFIVDTGAEYSVLSPEITAAAKVETTPTGARLFGEASLAFGGVTLPRERVMVMPFDNFRRQGRAVQGLIGYGLFERYAVTIDYDRKVLELRQPGSKPSDVAQAVPVRFAGRLAAVTVTIAPRGGAMGRGEGAPGSKLTASVILDTGASQSLLLRHPFAAAHGLFDVAAGSTTTTAPSLASGDQSFVRLPARTIGLSTWTFGEPFVRLFARPTGSGGYTETDGLIGNELLRRFRVTIDYSRKTMWLEPNAHLEEPFTK